jgi:hypothetical protein
MNVLRSIGTLCYRDMEKGSIDRVIEEAKRRAEISGDLMLI